MSLSFQGFPDLTLLQSWATDLRYLRLNACPSVDLAPIAARCPAFGTP
ncbi:hypothetical protein ACGFMK_07835 [Amycolatopsis sp. NPDC049252]